MRLIDPTIQIKIDRLRDEKEILLQKYIYYQEKNNKLALDGLEVILTDIISQLKSLEEVKYI